MISSISFLVCGCLCFAGAGLAGGEAPSVDAAVKRRPRCLERHSVGCGRQQQRRAEEPSRGGSLARCLPSAAPPFIAATRRRRCASFLAQTVRRGKQKVQPTCGPASSSDLEAVHSWPPASSGWVAAIPPSAAFRVSHLESKFMGGRKRPQPLPRPRPPPLISQGKGRKNEGSRRKGLRPSSSSSKRPPGLGGGEGGFQPGKEATLLPSLLLRHPGLNLKRCC